MRLKLMKYFLVFWSIMQGYENCGDEDYKKAIALSQLCYWLSEWIGLWVRKPKAIVVSNEAG